MVARRMVGRRVVLVEDEREIDEERERFDMEGVSGWPSSGMVSVGAVECSQLDVVFSSQFGDGQSASQTDDSAVAHSLLSEGAEAAELALQPSCEKLDMRVTSFLSSGPSSIWLGFCARQEDPAGDGGFVSGGDGGSEGCEMNDWGVWKFSCDSIGDSGCGSCVGTVSSANEAAASATDDPNLR